MSQSIDKTERMEKVFTVIWMLSLAGSFLLFPPQELPITVIHEPVGGKLAISLLNIFNNLVFLGILLKHWKKIFDTVSRNLSFLLLLGVVVLSIFWTVDIPSTSAESRGVVRVSLMGIYLAWRYDFKTQMHLFSWVLGVTAIFNLATCLFLSQYGFGIHKDYDGAWCGIYDHKNELGYMMVFGGILFLLLAFDSAKYRFINLVFFIICSFLVFKSSSTSAISNLLSIFISLPIYKILQKNSNNKELNLVPVILVVLIVSGVIIFLKSSAETLLGYAGKDLTLTGRSDLWQDLMEWIVQRPLLGYGYSSFWHSESTQSITSRYDWAVDAHNGFIQLLVDLGLLGFTLFSISFLQFSLKSLKKILLDSKSTLDFFPMQFLIFLVISNNSEARLLQPAWIWFVYAAILFTLTLEEKRQFVKLRFNGVR